MAKRKKTAKKTAELKFKKRFLDKKMFGNIQGIELPKLYKDFTQEDKIILYYHNPQRSPGFFEDVSNVPPLKVKEAAAEETENLEDEQKEQTDGEQQ